MLPAERITDPPYPTKASSTVFRRALAHPWLLLSLWLVLLAAVHVPQHGWSWHFLAAGVHALFSSAPLSLYAHHPELQMGPLTFVIAAPFVLLLHGVPGEVAGMVLMLALGLVVVREIGIISVGRTTKSDLRWWVTSLLFLVVWAELAVHWGHFDDALALLAGVVGLRLVRQGRAFAAAVAFGLAVDFKPWALPFVVLLLLAPRRSRLPAVAVFVAVVGAAWLPFILGDPGTLTALRFGIPVDAASPLHLFDPAAGTTPRWDRYAQAGIAVILGALAVWRQRWVSVLAIVFTVRLLLDPATKNYYDAGLVVGTAVFDLTAVVGVIPITTVAAIVFVYLPSYALRSEPLAHGILRTVGLVLILAITTVTPPRHKDTARVASAQDDLGPS